MARQRRQVGHRLVLDLAVLPVGAPQVGRGVVPAVALLIHIPGLRYSDYVDFASAGSHSLMIWSTRPSSHRDTPKILTTLCKLRQLRNAGQRARNYRELRQLGTR